ncbi:hypothetical protein [Salisaeta longa]|uniref:hypothetical protein n=1 Tax=Salisaeta longa TaxID=503170 RepID=UPI000402FF60|nr:hypothetical protein [Salisaeta longa]
MRRLLVLGVFCLLVVGCDASEQPPDASFTLSLSAPVHQTVQGKAAMNDGAAFNDQFFFPIGSGFGSSTVIQLYGTPSGASGSQHALTFMLRGFDELRPGTYEVNTLGGLGGGYPEVVGFRAPAPALFDSLGALTWADYSRMTADSVVSYPLPQGTLTIERADDAVIRGRFSLSASRRLAIAREALEAYVDSLRAYDPGTMTNLPMPPTFHGRPLAAPLRMEGRFTARSLPLSDAVPPTGLLTGGLF